MRQLELFAEDLRKSIGLGGDEIVDAVEFAERLVGTDCIDVIRHLPYGARLKWSETGYRIELRDGLADMNFACAHEVAHWALREVARYKGPHEERYANYLGAALLAPRSLVRAGLVFYGRKLEAVAPLSHAVLISQTAANLRLGEVLCDERVVVTKSGNVLRNAETSFAMPDTLVVARARDERDRPGIARALLCGGIDEGRVALRGR